MTKICLLSAYSVCGNFVFNLLMWCLALGGQERFRVFEEMVLDAVRMVIFFFWFTLGFTFVMGALWLRAAKKVS